MEGWVKQDMSNVGENEHYFLHGNSSHRVVDKMEFYYYVRGVC